MKSKALHTRTLALHLSDLKDRSLAAVQRPVLGTPNLSNDAVLLASLMSFVLPGTPLEFLRKGAHIRKRWSQEGGVVDLRASHFFVHHEIEELLNDSTRLRDAWICCQASNPGLGSHVPEVLSSFAVLPDDSLDPDLKLFWSFQAMVLICGAVPWKSLEPISVDYFKLAECLCYTVQGFAGDVKEIPDAARLDILYSLIEAVRFSKLLKRRKLAINLARKIAPEDHYSRLLIAQAESQVKRLEGDPEAARRVLPQIQQMDQTTTASVAGARSARGQIFYQQSLNHIQYDQTDEAIQSLMSWSPGTTSMEAAVKFQHLLLWARILRYRNESAAGHTKLEELESFKAEYKDLDFEEFRPEFVYQLAALYIDEERYVIAETRILDQLEQMKSTGITYPTNISLRLLLAESRFGQGRLGQAEKDCNDVEADCRLKFDRIHWNIIVAKIHHTQLAANSNAIAHRDKAFKHWNAANALMIGKQLNDGHSTRVLQMSILNVLSYFQDREAQNARETAEDLLQRARYGSSERSVKNWIPGFSTAWKRKMEEAQLATKEIYKL
ncbi:hypothetical protein FOQG_16583 [Fusarium oxysporum f. sp. raphani 54005]|uniref:Uncharacterized protein n=2 Tax=Fusarium oxysporum f. sp. raphani TaxID=96318 RepID=X0BJY4_FUSOX|nr:hypothetical protein FOQG_16583 [Fusarium oxysporum f. sp. raphani 54005]